MNPNPFVGLVVTIVFVGLLFWVPSEILKKAGFARYWAILIIITGYVGLIVLALVEWPVQMELAWYRLKEGDASAENLASAENYAVQLEKAGDWKKAEEVFLELIKRSSSADSSDYYLSCLNRLREKAAGVELV